MSADRATFAVADPREVALERLLELNGQRTDAKGLITVTVAKQRLLESLEACKDAGLEMLSDIFGMDYLEFPGHQGKRFAVLYSLHDVTGVGRLFLKVEVDDGETLPTATHIWSGANFLERETFDMMGVVFEGHPNLRKLLTPEDLDGHPHRKDFPIGETPVLFNDGRFIDPAAFRSGLIGKDPGLTGWKGGARDGVESSQGTVMIDAKERGEQ